MLANEEMIFKDKTWIEKAANSVQDKVDLFAYITGLDKIAGMRERGETRVANVGDFAALLDSSSDRYEHPNPFAHLSSGGPHDYHEGIASFTSGVHKPETDRPGEADPNYRTLTDYSNIAKDFTPSPQVQTSFTNMDASMSSIA